MKTIDIYSTEQCGFCKTLKQQLDAKNISYISHDVGKSEQALIEMREMSNGAMSVPVTVFDKGTSEQKVCIGYPDSAREFDLEKGNNSNTGSSEMATLTCPKCDHKQQGEIPTTACIPFYTCVGCGEIIKAEGEDCCVFCSYADKKCPLKKEKSPEKEICSDGVCSI